MNSRGMRRLLGLARWRALALVAILVPGVLSATATPAVAVQKFVHRVVATGPGTEAGESTATVGDVAVNYGSVADGSLDPLGQSTDGYVYVVDDANERINVFSADGQFQFMWGRGVLNGGVGPQVCDRTAASCTGGFAGSLGGAFNRPQGVAIDQDTGHVFVRERLSMRVQEFTAAGVFVRAWGWDVVQEGTPDDTPTDGFETCFDAAECKAGVTGAGSGQFGSSFFADGSGIDVDQDSGDVFVGDPGNQRIQRFDIPATTSHPIAAAGMFGSPANFASNVQPVHIAIDADGILYASDGGSGAEVGDEIERYDLEGDVAPGGVPGFLTPIVISTASGTSADASTRGLEVDPNTGNLFVARDRGLNDGERFSPVVELEDPGVVDPAGVSLYEVHVEGTNVGWTGIGFDPDSDELYLGGVDTGGNWILAANDGPLDDPIVTFDPYTGVSARGATVNFTIDTTGLVPVGYEVQLDNPDSPRGFTTVASGEIAGSATPVGVSEPVSRLLPGSAYQVRIVTSKPFNSLGGGEGATTENLTPLVTGSDAPSVTDVAVDSLEPSSARLTGRVNPNSLDTSYRFEWGTGNFDNSIPIPDAALGDGLDFEFVSQQLTGLVPGTDYQFRLVATNSEGETPSDTKTFTTPATAGSDTDRAYELVSPADKYGGQGVGFWPWGLGHLASSGKAAYVGERFILTGLYGSTLSHDGAFGLNTELMLAERVDNQQGWQAAPVLSHPDYQPSLGKTMEIGSAADDFSSIYWTGPATMVFFEEMAGANPDPLQPTWTSFDAGWLSEWDGIGGGPTRWELFGPRSLSANEIARQTDVAGGVWRVALSGDGASAFGMTLRAGNGPSVFGLGDDLSTPGVNEDPTSPLNGLPFGDLVGGRSIYAADLSNGLSDTFVGVGERELVNVCTGSGASRSVVPVVTAGLVAGAQCPAGVGGRQALISSRGAAYSSGDVVPSGGVVSQDGSRVFFLSPDPLAAGVPNGTSQSCTGTGAATVCAPQLFVRQRNANGDVVTRWVSKAEDGLFGSQASSLTGGVRFEGASADGSVVYFRTNSPLTADDPNGLGAPTPGGVKTGSPSGQSWDLYRFELSDGADPTGAGSSLTRVSSGPDETGDCNSPMLVDGAGISSGRDNDTVKALRFLSEDGNRAYFVCQAPLPGVAAANNGTITSPGGTPTTADQSNLYLYDANVTDVADRWRFIARIPRATERKLETCASTGVLQTSPLAAGNGQHPNIGSGTASSSNCVRGSSDGGFVSLFTTGQLTEDDTGGTAVDDPVGPVVADIYGYSVGDDRVVRLTAAQGGSEEPYPCTTDDPASDSPQDDSLEFACRGDGGVDGQIGAGRPATLGAALDPGVVGEDVAFFQSASRLVAGDNDDGYDVYEWRGGVLSLVTSGAADSKDALYKGNDRSGRDVYFVTREALTWQDTDAVADVYTARVGGGIVEPEVPSVCVVLADGCQGSGSGAPTPTGPKTLSSGAADEVDSGRRRMLVVSGVSAKARKRASRTGRLALSVRASSSGRVSLTVKAKLGRRTVRVGGTSKQVSKAGSVRMSVRLSSAARKRLRSGKKLRLAVEVRQSGGRPRSMSILLPGVGS